MQSIEFIFEILNSRPWLQILTSIGMLLAAAYGSILILKLVVLRLALKTMGAAALGGGADAIKPVASRLAYVVPAIVISRGVALVPHLPDALVVVAQNVAGAFIILTVALALGEALNLANRLYQTRPDAANRPIKGYLQVIKILIYVGAAVLIAAALMERSPLLLLSGLGAMAAVLMLVFKDTILSLVASVQLTSNDMLRVGDWIEMPQLNADGDVIDIALHTVKVQNWDKTITTIPTHRLVSESYKNWRGMFETGGRRIKRALLIDQSSIGFLSAEEQNRLRNFALLAPYLERKRSEIDQWNASLRSSSRTQVNARRITNIGTFRAYVMAYLRAHPTVAQDMTLLVRQLPPTAEGLPLELYCFTSSTAWAEYEQIQADIFDHLIAILPEFGLRLFQAPSGLDIRRVLTEAAERRPLAMSS